MTKFDRIDLTRLPACCVRLIQNQEHAVTEGDILVCGECGRLCALRDSIWTVHDETTAGRARRMILAQPPRVQAMYASHLSGDLLPLRALGILRQLSQIPGT